MMSGGGWLKGVVVWRHWTIVNLRPHSEHVVSAPVVMSLWLYAGEDWSSFVPKRTGQRAAA